MDTRETIDLINEIKAIQLDRQKHADAIAKIDATLARIGAMLTATGQPFAGLDELKAELSAADFEGDGSRRARKYKKLEQTGKEFIVDFLRQKGPSTTAAINRAWRGQGRGGVANNILGVLLKEGSITRAPAEGRRGSVYRAANAKASRN